MCIVLATQCTIQPTSSIRGVNPVLKPVKCFVPFRVVSYFVLAFTRKNSDRTCHTTTSTHACVRSCTGCEHGARHTELSESELSCLNFFCTGAAAKKSVIRDSAIATHGRIGSQGACMCNKKGARRPGTPLCGKHWHLYLYIYMYMYVHFVCEDYNSLPYSFT